MIKRQILYPILAVTLLLASCTADETIFVPNEAQQLAVTVTDGGYASAISGEPSSASATRTVENGYTTEFTTGDACGLFVARDGKMIYANVKLTAETDATTGDLVWKPDGSTALAGGLPDEHYYLYYPYQTSMDGKTAAFTGNAPTDAEFFAPLIASWQPQEDQSTYTNYMKSDLMTAKGTATAGTSNTLRLSFSMTHRMALAVIEVPNTVKYKFTDARIPDYAVSLGTTFSGIAKPLRMNDGAYRYLVNHATAAPTIEGSYSSGRKVFTITPSGLATGSYKKYKVDGAMTTVKDYTLQRGDYLLIDGNLLPKGTALTEEQKASVAGIVFWTPAETETEGRATPASLAFDKVRAKEHPCCNHGLVVSIKNVSSGDIAWQNVYDGVADFQNGTNFTPVNKADYVSVRVSLGDKFGTLNWILGYQNTKVLCAYNDYCTANGKTELLVNPAELLKTFIAQNPAPANSTGWYIPSAKELHMLCYKDVDDITRVRGSSYSETRKIVDASISAVGGDLFGERNNYKDYWSSSEIRAQSAYYVYSYLASVASGSKNSNAIARAVCAF